MSIRKRVRLFVILLAVIGLTPGTRSPEAADTGSLYEQLTRCVLRLEYTEEVLRPGQEKPEIRTKPAGTAFIVRYQESVFLVTARHVTNRKFHLRARVPLRNNRDSLVMHVLNIPWKAWRFHPMESLADEYPIDVAVASIVSQPEGHKIMQLQESLFSTEDPVPPRDVLVFGYPANIGFELETQFPLARVGIVALSCGSRFLKVDGRFFDESGFLLDAPIFAGNSGSPVFSKRGPRDSLKLLGIVSASNTSLSYAVCEPVSRIIETLQAALDKRISRSDLPFWEDIE